MILTSMQLFKVCENKIQLRLMPNISILGIKIENKFLLHPFSLWRRVNVANLSDAFHLRYEIFYYRKLFALGDA